MTYMEKNVSRIEITVLYECVKDMVFRGIFIDVKYLVLYD